MEAQEKMEKASEPRHVSGDTGTYRYGRGAEGRGEGVAEMKEERRYMIRGGIR